MMKATVSSALAALIGCTLTSVTLAGPPFKAKPFVFDPDKTGIAAAAWVTHEGLPDAGSSDHALSLQKNGLTATNAAGGAVIEGVEGITLSEIGFDVRNDSQCSGGAPRFNVTASDGFHFLGGCGNATNEGPVGASDYNRYRIDPTNPAQAFPPITPGATIISISLIFDEGNDVGPGFAFVDNIDINGVLIGKPGNAR